MKSSREQLRTLFLFEALTDEQLDWLVERAELRTYAAGSTVAREGEPAAYLFVLVDGELALTRRMVGEEVVLNLTSQRGAYGGATRAYIEKDEIYSATITTTQPSSFLCLPAQDFAEMMRRWFPLAVHLLDGLYVRVWSTEAQVRQREQLASLGTLSANLAHELNNPASATVRATSQLRERVAGMRGALVLMASGNVPPEQLRDLIRLQERAVELAAKAPHDRTPLEIADAEDELAERIEALGVEHGHELAPVYVAAGLTPDWLSDVVTCSADSGADLRATALQWLAYTLETEDLLNEIEDASNRISTLVAAVKQYSHMDQAAHQEVDIHLGIDSTIVMLGPKLAGVQLVRDYDRELPPVPAYAAELNQVWTNLLDNAAYAVGGRGTIVVRTRQEADSSSAWAVVEVTDSGPGIEPAVLPRIWEQFFTTKPAGVGSGLGLESVRRIVESRHDGKVDVETGPDGTTFRVRLPLPR